MMSDIVDGEQHRKENLQEYARLLGDQYYERVSFDEESGGLSAVHKNRLYFPNESLFSEQRVREGWRDYCSYAKESDYNSIIKVLCVAGGGIYQIEKPSW